MTDKELFITLVDQDQPKKSDAIILLEGDGFFRLPWAAELYKRKMAKLVVVTGGMTNSPNGSFPARPMAARLLKLGVPKKAMVVESQSQHTRAQAVSIMKLARERKWKKIILVGSNWHQHRAFLTFLKAMQEARMKLQIFNSPAPGLPWFKKTPWAWGSRLEMLQEDFKKIEQYGRIGHVADFKTAVAYQKWKERQL